MAGLMGAVGSSRMLATSQAAVSAPQPAAGVETIQDVIDLIVTQILAEPLEQTIDTVKVGNPSQKVTGIASTFLPTLDVLKRAHAIGANLVIPHEPTWYNHYDRVEHLQGDSVYEAKLRFLEETGLVIWRFHDYSHRMKPDVIVYGVVRRLGWKNYQTYPDDDRLYDIPEISFEELSQRCFEELSQRSRPDLGLPISAWWETRARNAGVLPSLPVGGAPESWMTTRSYTWSRRKRTS